MPAACFRKAVNVSCSSVIPPCDTYALFPFPPPAAHLMNPYAPPPHRSNTYSALNALAGHYNNFGTQAPIPKKRLERLVKVG